MIKLEKRDFPTLYMFDFGSIYDVTSLNYKYDIIPPIMRGCKGDLLIIGNVADYDFIDEIVKCISRDVGRPISLMCPAKHGFLQKPSYRIYEYLPKWESRVGKLVIIGRGYQQPNMSDLGLYDNIRAHYNVPVSFETPESFFVGNYTGMSVVRYPQFNMSGPRLDLSKLTRVRYFMCPPVLHLLVRMESESKHKHFLDFEWKKVGPLIDRCVVIHEPLGESNDEILMLDVPENVALYLAEVITYHFGINYSPENVSAYYRRNTEWGWGNPHKWRPNVRRILMT